MTAGEGDRPRRHRDGGDADDPVARELASYRFRWRVVLASAVTLVAVSGWLVTATHNQGRDTAALAAANRSTAQQAARAAERADQVADATRANLCAWLYTLVANPPPDPTPDQAIRFAFYRSMYGEGTPETPGLECERPLPEGGSGG